MTQVASGLVPALVNYYQRLEADPAQAVAAYGFSREKIHFAVVLDPDGTLISLDDIRERNDRGKPIPALLLLPDSGGRSGTGLKPYFCWDNTGYALGRDNKDKPERAASMFAEFRKLHLSFRDHLASDEGFLALCRFLERWDPSQAESLPNWTEAAGLNVVFKVRARAGYVHQSDAVRGAWLRHVAAEGESEPGVRGTSLVSGEEEEIARLHPQISGVTGANTTGAAIVSFNLNAFESYGKSQSYNAPVGTRDAFRYTTALNRLLADGRRRVRIGDATVVFWTERQEAADAEEFFRELFGEDAPQGAEHQKTADRLRVFLDAARQGRLADQLSDPDAPFYVLGLSPNASRLNVRYYLAGTVREFAERLMHHAADLEMIGARPEDPPLVIRRLVAETAREPKDVAPQLAGEVARSVLGGLPYPQILFTAVIRRVRADSVMNHRRAAILKACLVRKREKEVPVALDRDHPDEAYQCGRLFAALEKTQEDATDGKLNSTIKDRYFGAAGATPAAVFPRLMRIHQHHMNKLEHEGQRILREKLIGEIFGRITGFPAHLALAKQGLFYIGYYHQRQDFFTKKPETTEETTHE
ncbi:MAG: type I-C CRISPR-associated protein Cas8c/Csd1 [Isosphaeraceae bacterium]